MQLTRFTDFSLRVLIYAGAHPDGVVTISEMAEAYQIPRNHLVKVVNHLATTGFLSTTRGNGGGVKLARSPKLITLGSVVRQTEASMELVECFNEAEDTECPLFPACVIRGALMQAKESFLATLDKVTVADCLQNKWPNKRSDLVKIAKGDPPARRVPSRPSAGR